MKKEDLDEYGFNKNYSYDTNVDHFEFEQHNNDGMYIDENGSVRYGKPNKKIKKKKDYNHKNRPSSKNKIIALVAIIIIFKVVKAIIPIISDVIEDISLNSSTNSSTYSYNDNSTEDIYNNTYPTEYEYTDYDYDKGYLSISGDNTADIAAEIAKVINFDSFNNFTLTYNNPENFDDYYLAKYNETVQYCKDNNIDYSLPNDASRHYIDIYDVENIDYLNVEYYNDETYDYSYFDILLVQDLDKLGLTEPIDLVFSGFTSSLGDNSQQICETFKRLSEYCSTNAVYLSDISFYGSIYDDNFSIYYDYTNGQLILSVTIENPNYYDTSF